MKNLIKWTRWEFSFGNTRVWRFIFLICTRFSWSLECLVFVEEGKIEEPKTLRAFQTLTARDYILLFWVLPFTPPILPSSPSLLPSVLGLSSLHSIFSFPTFGPYFIPSSLQPPPPALPPHLTPPPLSTPHTHTHTFFYFTSLPLLSEETNWISLYIPVTVSLLNQ